LIIKRYFKTATEKASGILINTCCKALFIAPVYIVRFSSNISQYFISTNTIDIIVFIKLKFDLGSGKTPLPHLS